jgi:uncharacterized delta-60 repeat protein
MKSLCLPFTQCVAIACLAFGLNASAAETTGATLTALAGASPEASTVLVQPDGQIIVYGTYGEQVEDFDQFLIRLRTDGSVDPSFGQQGVVKNDFGGVDIAKQALLQPDGKILTLCFSETPSYVSRYVISRYNPDGSPDASFGKKGQVLLELASSGNPVGFALLPNGELLVAGDITRNQPGGDFKYAFTLNRFKPDGTLDTAYGNKGRVVFEPASPHVFAHAMHLQTDGKVIMAGLDFPTGGRFDPVKTFMVLVRFLPDGRLDPEFGEAGVVQRDLTQPALDALAVRSLPDGQLLVAGTVVDERFGWFGVLRLKANGLTDPTFGTKGLALAPFGKSIPEPLIAQGFDLQADGKLILVGNVELEQSRKIGVTRLLNTGALDVSFAKKGVQMTSLESQYTAVRTVTVQIDGKIVVAGDVYRGEGRLLAVVRYLPDGSPDPTFGGSQ